MGKGKSTGEDPREHQSAPLSSLRDPASFGPPPKRIGQAGSTTPTGSASGGGLGGTGQDGGVVRPRLQASREAESRAQEEANKPPPGPYRADTTGLQTAHLPKPPVFRPGQTAPSPPPARGSKPNLPPRLPPRQNSHPNAYSQPPPPPYSEAPSTNPNTHTEPLLNQTSINRLGNAGIAVPGLNIGGRVNSPPVPPRQTPPPPVSPAETRAPQLNELESRFAHLSTSRSEAPGGGTSWAEKQNALNTARNLREDPSKVSLSDMRAAASTANNFGERHGGQVAAGWRAANSLNQQYGAVEQAQPATTPPPVTCPTQGKRPPPPPPPKKKELASNPPGQPPPVPLASKPRF